MKVRLSKQLDGACWCASVAGGMKPNGMGIGLQLSSRNTDGVFPLVKQNDQVDRTRLESSPRLSLSRGKENHWRDLPEDLPII